MKTILLLIYSNLILATAKKPTFWEKVQYFKNLVMTFGPVVALMEALHIWFTDNSNFIAGVVVALVINMGVGIVYHLKMETFNWWEFFVGNAKMFFAVSVVYVLLELLRSAMGSNVLISDGFKLVVQTTTIIYPISKAVKNIHILTNKEFPPAAIMNRLYNFEKTGDVKELYRPDEENNNLNNVG